VDDGAGPEAGKHRVLRYILLVAALSLLIVPAAAWILSPRPTDPAAAVRDRLLAAGGTYVPLDAVSLQLREAVVAAEDERFWSHHGVDAIGLARACAYDVSHLSLRQGASTITEQLGKDLYLGGNDHSLWRKLGDAAIAIRLESDLSKDQILELYLNEVYFGGGAVGVGQASERFFGTTPSQVSLGQAALLAGAIEAPSLTDPFTDPAAARDRQAQVLTSMVRDGYITAPEANEAVTQPLPLAAGMTLPPDRDASVEPSPQLSMVPLAFGLVLLALGIFGYALARRRQLRPWSGKAFVPAVVGLFLIARAFRAD
jgi:membrane peptidoglycan carboxypeptidase